MVPEPDAPHGAAQKGGEGSGNTTKNLRPPGEHAVASSIGKKMH